LKEETIEIEKDGSKKRRPDLWYYKIDNVAQKYSSKRFSH
jgi:hypothetical protein